MNFAQIFNSKVRQGRMKMNEEYAREQIESYLSKAVFLGVNHFELEYDEESEEVVISEIHAEGGDTLAVPFFVSRIEYKAWCGKYMLRACKLLLSDNCIIEFEDPYCKNCGDSLSRHFSEIVVSQNHKAYALKDGVLFNKEQTELLVYPTEKTDSEYMVPESVVVIKERAFHYNEYLKKLWIPENVVEIERCDFYYETQIDVDKRNVSYKSVDGSLYSKNGKILYHIAKRWEIKIEEGTVLLKDIFLEGTYKELYLPRTLQFNDNVESSIILGIEQYELEFYAIQVPKHLRKYFERIEDLATVYYY